MGTAVVVPNEGEEYVTFTVVRPGGFVVTVTGPALPKVWLRLPIDKEAGARVMVNATGAAVEPVYSGSLALIASVTV